MAKEQQHTGSLIGLLEEAERAERAQFLRGLDKAKRLLQERRQEPLLAAFEEDWARVQQLLEDGASPHYVNANKNSALHLAA